MEEDTLFDTTKTFGSLEVSGEIQSTLEKLNYKHPTRIQAESLPYTLKGRDIIALAETGSGKTLAFALPIIEALMKNPRPFFALVLAPTRELCLQIHEHFTALGSAVGLKSVVIVGGLDLMAQSVALVSKKPHVIIATPGRILHHLENTKGFSLQKLSYLVLDEADKLLDLNFEEALDKIVGMLPKQRHTFLFSATMTNKVSKLQRACLSNPVKIEVSKNKHQTVNTLTQKYLFFPQKYKESYLVHTLNTFLSKSSIVFTTTCRNAMRICLLLRNLGFEAVTIHGQMTQVKRLNALNKFKTSAKTILVATDVASRGLDLPNVDLVLNFDLPANSKDYVHRVGRTARAGRAGLALSFVTQYDVEGFQKIEHAIGKKLEDYAADEAEVLVYHEKVLEAGRIADFEIKKLAENQKDNQKRGRILDDEDRAEETGKKSHRSKGISKGNGNGNGNGKGFKKPRRREE